MGRSRAHHIGEDTDRAEKRQTNRPPGQPMRDVMRVAVPEQSVHKDRQQREHRNQFDEKISQVRHGLMPFCGCSASQPCCTEPDPKAYAEEVR